MSNIEKLEKDDLFIDTMFNVTSIENSMFINGSIKNIEEFEGNLDIGRMPENENEIVIVFSPKSYYITDRLDELLSTKFKLEELKDKEMTVVRYKT